MQVRPTTEQLPRTIASGRYTLESIIGTGGTATVYRARDTTLAIDCAIKVISPELQVHRSLRQRLYKEAQAMFRLKHPNILRLYNIGLDETGRDYIVMELAEGGTLGQRLRDVGPLPPLAALHYTRDVLLALQLAHTNKIVHRDVKPDNVLLDRDGIVMLADFGIAMLTEDTLRSTQTNIAMGSLAFMPPEQRVDARSVGHTADLYATGAMLYNLLTDQNPIDLFTAPTSSARWTHLPPPLLDLLQKSTQMRPEDRYASAEEMIEAINLVSKHFSPDTPPLCPHIPRPPPPDEPHTFNIPRPDLDTTPPSPPFTQVANETIAPDTDAFL
ncbi:MAG: serine/threonine protein kinase, partial [Myxococcota bacterium]